MTNCNSAAETAASQSEILTPRLKKRKFYIQEQICGPEWIGREQSVAKPTLRKSIRKFACEMLCNDNCR